MIVSGVKKIESSIIERPWALLTVVTFCGKHKLLLRGRILFCDICVSLWKVGWDGMGRCVYLYVIFLFTYL